MENYNVENEEMELNIPEETDLEVIDMPPQEDYEPSKASKGLMLAGAVGIGVGVYKVYQKIAPKLKSRKLKKAKKLLEEAGISVIEPVQMEEPEPQETTVEGQDETKEEKE